MKRAFWGQHYSHKDPYFRQWSPMTSKNDFLKITLDKFKTNFLNVIFRIFRISKKIKFPPTSVMKTFNTSESWYFRGEFSNNNYGMPHFSSHIILSGDIIFVTRDTTCVLKCLEGCNGLTEKQQSRKRVITDNWTSLTDLKILRAFEHLCMYVRSCTFSYILPNISRISKMFASEITKEKY